MGSLSIWHWLIVVLIPFATVTIPLVKLFPRAGLPAWLGLFGIVPVIALIFLWVLAFKRWPGDPE